MDVGSGVEISLGEVVDRAWGWLPATKPPPLRAEIHHGEGEAAPLVPAWSELAALQAQGCTREMSGSGVLVTPDIWRESPQGRQLLSAWNASGWHWTSMEQVLELRFGKGVRLAVPTGLWVRIRHGRRRVTVPNGAEAALALQMTEPVLERLLGAVEGSLASRWWKEEHDLSGWFVRQRISRLLAQALHLGASSVDLGEGGKALFAFSGPEARETFADLANLRVAVDLPAPPANWWRQASKAGFLHPSPGQRGRFEAKWEESETVLVEHPPEELEEQAEFKSLKDHLQFNSLPYRSEDPANLLQAWDLATDLEKWLARTLAEDEERRQAAGPKVVPDEEEADSNGSGGESRTLAELPPAPIGDPLEGEFDPQIFRLDTPHRRSGVQIRRVDDEHRELQATLREPEPGEILYEVEEELTHGTVIRIDYHPQTLRGRGA